MHCTLQLPIFLIFCWDGGRESKKAEAVRHPRGSVAPPRMPPSGTSFFLSISRCETLILEEQANGFQWSKRGFPSHGVGTLLLSPTSSCAPHHGNIDQALDPLLPRWFAVFRHRCFSCCFCDSPIWSAAGPIRLMVSDFRISPFSMARLVYCSSSFRV